MFCAAHAFSMACDSLYAAWLKVHYPYELYLTMLKLYDEKHRKDKIAAIISEMKRYKNISLTIGRFGQDNRDWLVDKEAGTISQSLSSVGYMSKQVAKDLYEAGQKEYVSFTDVLRELQMNTCLNTRQIKILIELDYFEEFGRSGKLMKVFDSFYEGENKVTKTVKSYATRMKAIRTYEESLPDEKLPIKVKLSSELEYMGLCLSTDKTVSPYIYFVIDTDTKFGVKASFYSVNRGTSGVVRIKKGTYEKNPFNKGDCIRSIKHNISPKYTFKGGTKSVLPGEEDIWIEQYEVLS